MDASDEWSCLWRELFGEPPPIRSDVGLLAEILIAVLPPAPPYSPGVDPPGDGACD